MAQRATTCTNRIVNSTAAMFAAGLIAGTVGIQTATAQSLTVTSDDIKEGGVASAEMVANTFGCSGGNVSPSVKWSGAPAGTKSFAINLYDPDAPTGGCPARC